MALGGHLRQRIKKARRLPAAPKLTTAPGSEGTPFQISRNQPPFSIMRLTICTACQLNLDGVGLHPPVDDDPAPFRNAAQRNRPEPVASLEAAHIDGLGIAVYQKTKDRFHALAL